MATAPAQAALPARPDGPILDAANVIAPEQQAMLDAKLREYNAATGRAIIVATVPSLDGLPIETYAQDMAETWGIGGKETENGLLFLIAPDDKELRIHTGRGLQVRMTDIMSGRIIRDVVVPRFKANDMSGGIVAGTDAIVEQLNMDPAEARAIEEAEAARRASESHGGNVIGSAIFWIVIIVFFIGIFSRGGRRRGRRGSGFGGAVGNIILWEVVSAAARAASDNDWDGGGGGGFGGGGGGGFGGFGGGGGGFNGGGASGSW